MKLLVPILLFLPLLWQTACADDSLYFLQTVPMETGTSWDLQHWMSDSTYGWAALIGSTIRYATALDQPPQTFDIPSSIFTPGWTITHRSLHIFRDGSHLTHPMVMLYSTERSPEQQAWCMGWPYYTYIQTHHRVVLFDLSNGVIAGNSILLANQSEERSCSGGWWADYSESFGDLHVVPNPPSASAGFTYKTSWLTASSDGRADTGIVRFASWSWGNAITQSTARGHAITTFRGSGTPVFATGDFSWIAVPGDPDWDTTYFHQSIGTLTPGQPPFETSICGGGLPCNYSARVYAQQDADGRRRIITPGSYAFDASTGALLWSDSSFTPAFVARTEGSENERILSYEASANRLGVFDATDGHFITYYAPLHGIPQYVNHRASGPDEIVLLGDSIRLFLLSAHFPPGTEVDGNVSGIWDSTSSPYYVSGDVTVPAGQTLEIGPGVQVQFTGHYKFNVFGTLHAIGTEQDSIVFTRAYPTEESRWWGVRFVNAQNTSRMEYCLIEHGRAILGTDPYDDAGGGLMTLLSSLTFSHCRIAFNTASRSGGAAYCDAGIVHFENCLFDHDSVGGGGILVGHNASLTFDRCTIADNVGQSPVIGTDSGPNLLTNSIVWSNSQTSIVGMLATYSDIQGGYPGTGNIDTDPLFVDAANNDFHIQSTSPCIDAGDPNTPLDRDSTRADMGAFPFLPRLVVSPLALDYGLRDVGTDSAQAVLLANPGGFAIPLLSITHANSAFVIDTSGLNGAVPPHSTYSLNVTFRADAVGSYSDTLVITATQPDSVFRIPLSGQADILLPPVDGLVIRRGAGNSMQLNWAPITHSISGRPYTPPYYIIYGATTPAGPYVPIDMSPTNSYVHSQFNLQPFYFYRVSAGTEEVARRR